ncbi:3-hydroxybutyryl-CoA dehydrogenase [Thermostaphylospora chromogena]|uniref:3-hydroxyacyl-CoA dehydrogenase n=1 Tax=Thermostaphylospora chromogena TaxID=35622 RepID=A0A1H0ZPZ4_9ACTN|nr:3-hydroxybutyryl-CoA dehydrogenase [Thermostaphylospora chromogena]SDQ29595.1 3-hydroxyacyl-CoA dehydrogenase [Thermostaphylospora chromogena]
MNDGPSRIGVVGCGLMGAGIAEICARAGLDVLVAVSGPSSVDRARRRVADSLSRLADKGKIDREEADAAARRIRITSALEDFADREFVFESVTENETTKAEVFTALDGVLRDSDAILATNTSSLPIVRLAKATRRPERVIGTHFFNPVPVLPLVEVTASLLTSEETLHTTEALLTGPLGKQVIRSRDRAGFIVNALLVPYLLSAVRMVESGHATAEEIDTGMTLGCAHPIGPLRLIDLIGVDTLTQVASGLYEEYRDPVYSVPPLLARMADGGLLGRKSGQGFYAYPS